MSDASAPRPSLHSVESQTSLDVSSMEVSPSDGVFDDEGLLFGDSESSLQIKCCNYVFLFLASCDDPLGSGLDTNNQLTHGRLWITQFYALLVKRVHYTKGKIVALMVQNLFPLVLITLSLLIARSLQAVSDPPPLELSPHLFFAKSRYNYLFAGGYRTNETAPMIDSLFRPCGIAAHSLGSAECYNFTKDCDNYPHDQYSCTCPPCNQNLSQNVTQTYDPLSPDLGYLTLQEYLLRSQCNQSADPPPCYHTFSGSMVQDLTETYDPLSPDLGYLALQEYLLRSTDAFIQQRYGGVSFGHFREDVPASVDELNADSGSLPFLATHSAAKVWYSLKGYHAMPSYLNTMNNAILRGSLNDPDDQPEYGEVISPLGDVYLLHYIIGITTVSHPFKITDLKKSWYAIT